MGGFFVKIMKELVVTQEGYEKLVSELNELKNVKRPAVIIRIKAAKELGDLSENADYDDARNEQSFVEGRIQELEEMVKRAKIVRKATGASVGIGSKVTVESGGEKMIFEIVGATESDPARGKISDVSPTGKALMGKIQNETVAISTPGGEISYKVLKIE